MFTDQRSLKNTSLQFALHCAADSITNDLWYRLYGASCTVKNSRFRQNKVFNQNVALKINTIFCSFQGIQLCVVTSESEMIISFITVSDDFYEKFENSTGMTWMKSQTL